MSFALGITCTILVMVAAAAAAIYLCIDDIRDYHDMCKRAKRYEEGKKRYIQDHRDEFEKEMYEWFLHRYNVNEDARIVYDYQLSCDFIGRYDEISDVIYRKHLKKDCEKNDER